MTDALRLRRLSVLGFRNLATQELSPHPRFTRIVGENGQGKTNLVEAIHYALTLRPLRSGKLRELIAHGEKAASLQVSVALGDAAMNLRVSLDGSIAPLHRALYRETKPVAADAYLVAGAVVAFTPDDLGIVRGGPERRRRFLDRAVFNRWPAYLGEVRSYQRLLKSRNQLLRERAATAVREAFEPQLWDAGARVAARRHALLAEWQTLVKSAFDRIGLAEVTAKLEYGGHATTERLAALAAEKLPLDQERGFTSIGPHVDDVALKLGGRSARLYASQGQARALVLALKVAEIENLRAQVGHAPVLLLDDVSSELDPKRNQSFMGYLRELPTQVLLTTTDDQLFGAAIQGQSERWLMSQGVVKIE